MKQLRITDGFEIQKRIMSVMGYWHKENSSVFFKLRGLLSLMIFLVSYFGMLMEFIEDIGDINKVSEILYLLTSYTSSFCKAISYLYARKTFLRILTDVSDPIFISHSLDASNNLTQIVHSLIFLAKFYGVSGALAIVFFCIYPIFENTSLPMAIPLETGRYTFLVYIIEVVALSIAAWNNFCLDTLFVGFIRYAVFQLDVLKEAISKCSETEPQHMEKALYNCVIHHNAIIR